MSETHLQDDTHKVLWALTERVRDQISQGMLLWIAKQDDPTSDELYGFAFSGYPDHGFAAVTLTEARNADDALVRELATKVMGYAPGSKEDHRHRLLKARQEIERLDTQIEQMQAARAMWGKEVSNSVDALLRLLGDE